MRTCALSVCLSLSLTRVPFFVTGPRKLTPEQAEALRKAIHQAFDILDLDKSGYIDAAEVEAVYRKLNDDKSNDINLTEEQLKNVGAVSTCYTASSYLMRNCPFRDTSALFYTSKGILPVPHVQSYDCSTIRLATLQSMSFAMLHPWLLHCIVFVYLYSAQQQPCANRGAFGSISSENRDKS